MEGPFLNQVFSLRDANSKAPWAKSHSVVWILAIFRLKQQLKIQRRLASKFGKIRTELC